MKLPNYIIVFPLWEILIRSFLCNLLCYRAELAMACGWNSNNYLNIYNYKDKIK